MGLFDQSYPARNLQSKLNLFLNLRCPAKYWSMICGHCQNYIPGWKLPFLGHPLRKQSASVRSRGRFLVLIVRILLFEVKIMGPDSMHARISGGKESGHQILPRTEG